MPPPPHEIENSSRTSSPSQRYRRMERLEARIPGGINIPSKPIVHNANDPEAGRRRLPLEGAVVVTVTLKSVAVLALNGMLAGAEQVALIGTPEQLSEAVPLIPSPPI